MCGMGALLMMLPKDFNQCVGDCARQKVVQPMVTSAAAATGQSPPNGLPPLLSQASGMLLPPDGVMPFPQKDAPLPFPLPLEAADTAPVAGGALPLPKSFPLL